MEELAPEGQIRDYNQVSTKVSSYIPQSTPRSGVMIQSASRPGGIIGTKVKGCITVPKLGVTLVSTKTKGYKQ